jgi:hypothetical protein
LSAALIGKLLAFFVAQRDDFFPPEVKTGLPELTPAAPLPLQPQVEPVGGFTLKGIRRPMMAYNVLESSPSKLN